LNSRERRFSERYNAAPLQVELQLKKLFGGWQSPHRAIAVDIAKGGIAILSPLKFRAGSTVQLAIGNDHHALRGVPASIVRQSSRDGDFVYGLHFRLDALEAEARNSAEIILSRMLATLEHSRGGIHAGNARAV